MTRDEFVKRWRVHLTGLMLMGHVSENRDGPMERAAKVCDMPAEAERLAGLMFDSAQQPVWAGEKNQAK